MGWFDGSLGWDDAIMFPSLITDAAWSGGKKLAGAAGVDNLVGGNARPIAPNFEVAKYGDGAKTTYSQRMVDANKTTNAGLGLMSAADDQAKTIFDRGAKIQGTGQNTLADAQQNANFARADQGGALGMMRSAAEGNTPSRAAILAQTMQEQNARTQRAQAAAARGGNAAAALRSAQATGAQNQLQTQQQLAALRADEMAQARDAYFGAASGMRAQDAQQAQLGAGLIGTGLQAQTAGTGIRMQAGNSMADVGTRREGAYLGAYSQAKTAELQARLELERQRLAAEAAARGANAGMMGSLFGAAGTVGGAMYGGPAGGAAGGAVGNAVGQKVGGG